MMTILGIDPGATGALALYEGGRITRITDMPMSGREIDAVLLAVELRRLCPARPQMVMIENQHAMPKQGVSSCFKLGVRFGAILGVCGAFQWPVEMVMPTRWKAFTKTSRDKDGARARASQMPEAAHHWTRVKDHGRAEAALIAWYGAHALTIADAA
jgi:hypothetical protein